MIHYKDRQTGQIFEERVWGEWALRFLYGNPLATPFRSAIARLPLFSKLMGWLQRRPRSRQNITPFIEKYGIDSSEFEAPPDGFASFDAFFTRRLKKGCRPLAADPAIIPADGRYLVYPTITSFEVKGRTFDLEQLLQDKQLAKTYADGSLAVARLAPTDCHRFAFPCAGTPGETIPIPGPLYSVNPLALKHNSAILTQNKRTLCRIVTEQFGTLLFLEVGATSVGTIHQTYHPGIPQEKGAEKGFFSFGGSSILLLFERGAIQFSEDLIQASASALETRCLLGQPLGKELF